MKKTNLLMVFAVVLASSVLIANVYADPDIGTGVLWVYTDSARTIEAPKGGAHGDTYFLIVGETYYIRVLGITEFSEGDKVTVKVCWKDISGGDQTTFFYDVEVKEVSGVRYVDVDWTVPSDAKICTTGTVHYRADGVPEYVAAGQVSTIGHIHIVPEYALGTIGSILAIFAGLGVFMLKTNKPKVVYHY